MNAFGSICKLMGLGVVALAAGCIGATGEAADTGAPAAAGDGDVGSASSAIIDGTLAQTWMQQRAVTVSTGSTFCTGTIISPNHVLTAAHCLPLAGNTTVRFYTSATNPGNQRGVTQVKFRPGVNPFNDDLVDTNGDFADIAILTLSSAIPATSVPAKLAIFYPGSDATGTQVGAGQHDGDQNSNSMLLYASNGLYSDDVSGGYFYTNDDRVNPGDSGGPIYNGNHEVLGDLWGYWLVAFALRNKYTAVPYHLPWILSSINYQGDYILRPNTYMVGTYLDAFSTDDIRTCKLACMQSSVCMGFAFIPASVSGAGTGMCHLKDDDVGADFAWQGVTSGAKP